MSRVSHVTVIHRPWSYVIIKRRKSIGGDVNGNPSSLQSGGATRDLVWVLGARVLSLTLQSLTLLLVARCAGPHAFGRYAVFLSVCSVVIFLSDLGLQAYSAREFSDLASRRSAMLGMQIQGELTGIVTCACVLVLGGMAGFPAILVPVGALVEKQLGAALSLALASHMAKAQALVLLLARAPVLALLCILVFVREIKGETVIAVFVGSSIVSGAIGCLIILQRVGMKWWRHGMSEAIAQIKGSFPFWLSSACWQLRQLDVALVGLVRNPSEAAFYAAPARLVGPTRILESSVSAVAIPYARRGEWEHLRRLTRLFAAGLIVMAVPLILVATYATHVVSTFLGRDYLPASGPLAILMLGTLPLMVAGYTSTVLQGLGDEKFVAIQAIGLSALFLVAVPLATLAVGPIGAAVGVALVNSTQCAVSCFRLRKRRAALGLEARSIPT